MTGSAEDSSDAADIPSKTCGERSLTLAPLTVGRPDPLTLIDAAACAEFDAVGMTARTPEGAVSRLYDDEGFVAEVERYLSERSLGVLDIGVITLSEYTDFEAVERVIAIGGRLGATIVIAVGWDKSFDRAAVSLSKVASIAGKTGLSVALEFMPYSWTRTLEEAKSIVREVNEPNVGLVLDVLHYMRSGGRVESASSADFDDVCLLQLCDGRDISVVPEDMRAEAVSDRLYPGKGQFPLRRILQLVSRDVPLTVEAPSRRHSNLSVRERAILVGECTRELLRGDDPV